MFKKENRLTSTLFKLLEDAKLLHTKNFYIKYTENLNPKATNKNKIATVVPKKVSKSAVERNKIKKRIINVLNHPYFTDAKNKPMLIAIYTKKSAQNLMQEDIRQELSCTQVFHSL